VLFNCVQTTDVHKTKTTKECLRGARPDQDQVPRTSVVRTGLHLKKYFLLSRDLLSFHLASRCRQY